MLPSYDHFITKLATNEFYLKLGRSPGLVVMGGDSCSKGCEFKSLHRKLDGHFSHLIVVKIVMSV